MNNSDSNGGPLENQKTNEETTITPRGNPKDELPFCWQSKTALRRIADDSLMASRAHPLLVYFAITWIASDKEASRLQLSKAYIAKVTGISPRAVADALYCLERIGVIGVERHRIEGKKAHDMNTYTLGSCAKVMHQAHEGNAPNARPSCKKRGRFFARKKNTPPRGEEYKEEGGGSPASPAAAGAAQEAAVPARPSFVTKGLR